MSALITPPDLTAFFEREGRLPRLGDRPPPWTYRGWLLPYVIESHALVPAVADRWGYHLRTLEAGRLLGEPIPQVAFGPPDPKVYGLLRDWSRLVGRDLGGWSDFRALLDWLCWGLALSGESPRLSEEVNEQLYRQVNVGRCWRGRTTTWASTSRRASPAAGTRPPSTPRRTTSSSALSR